MSQLAREFGITHNENKIGEPIPAFRLSANQAVTSALASVQSVAFGAATNVVRLIATQAAWVEFGANPTAVANTSIYLPANAPEYFACSPGHKVATLRAGATSGVLYVSEAL